MKRILKGGMKNEGLNLGSGSCGFSSSLLGGVYPFSKVTLSGGKGSGVQGFLLGAGRRSHGLSMGRGLLREETEAGIRFDQGRKVSESGKGMRNERQTVKALAQAHGGRRTRLSM